MGVRRCLARSLTSLAFRCALQRVQTVPAAIHSGRIPPPRQPTHGAGRLRQRFSPERKTPPGVSAPSAGLRPLSVSRVKCGGRTLSRPLSATMYGKYDMPSMDFKKLRKILISACRKHVVAATGPSPFKVGDNQRPERTMSGAAKTSA